MPSPTSRDKNQILDTEFIPVTAVAKSQSQSRCRGVIIIVPRGLGWLRQPRNVHGVDQGSHGRISSGGRYDGDAAIDHAFTSIHVPFGPWWARRLGHFRLRGEVFAFGGYGDFAQHLVGEPVSALP